LLCCACERRYPISEEDDRPAPSTKMVFIHDKVNENLIMLLTNHKIFSYIPCTEPYKYFQ
jgi:hypothetical protein